MNKQDVLNEIKRTAEANGGAPLGQSRFHQETGIRVSDWKGKFWVRWGDALREAGFGPNLFDSNAYDRPILIEKFIGLARELGHLPSVWDLRLKARQKPGFPFETAFSRSLGSKRQIAAKVLDYCNGRDGYDDISALCASVLDATPTQSEGGTESKGETFGSIY